MSKNKDRLSCLVSKQDKERLCALFAGDQQSGITKAARFQNSDGNHGAFLLDGSTLAKPGTSLSAFCTSFAATGAEASKTPRWVAGTQEFAEPIVIF